MVKTADLDPRNNYVMGFHPHGVLVAGAFTNFCTYATGIRQLFPGLTTYLLMLPLWFRAPFFRDYIMCAGVGQSKCKTHIWSDKPNGPDQKQLFDAWKLKGTEFKLTEVFIVTDYSLSHPCRSDPFRQRERHLPTPYEERWPGYCNRSGWCPRVPGCSPWYLQRPLGQKERLHQNGHGTGVWTGFLRGLFRSLTWELLRKHKVSFNSTEWS